MEWKGKRVDVGRLAKLQPTVTTLDTRQGSPVAVKRITGWQLVKIRKRIGPRDDYTCQICGRVTIRGEVDHIIPLHMGGAESDSNRQWLCKECHATKSEQEERGRGGSNV